MPEEIARAVERVVEARSADVFMFNSEITTSSAERVSHLIESPGRPKRTNVVLILVTYGGDPNAAYRIARCFQRNYERFTIIVPAACKSAGTLLAIGAHELVITNNGELGPLDIQMVEKDELFEMSSVLLISTALDELRTESLAVFGDAVEKIMDLSMGRISFRVAADVAAHLATSLFAPIYGHIQPAQIGASGRAKGITVEYGERLAQVSENIDEESISDLAGGFPSHEFSIDREEASDYFKEVNEPSEEESALLTALGAWCRRVWFEYAPKPWVGYISKNMVPRSDEGQERDAAGLRANRDAGAEADDTGRTSGGAPGSPTEVATAVATLIDENEVSANGSKL